MDFHTLSRKELQTLCKKNLIPANITNVAMADALTALTKVEGIEDIARSATETVPESPSTCQRTSTRRKPIKNPTISSIENEPKSSLPLTRSRLRSTRTMKQEEEQEKNYLKDLNENQSGSEIPETPVTLNGRKRVTSNRKKIETQIDKTEKMENPSVVQVYGTRRSARLMSEKKTFESVPKKGGRKTEAIKIDGALFEEESEDMEKESKPDAKEEIKVEERVNVMVDQEDLKSEDVSAKISKGEESVVEDLNAEREDQVSEHGSIAIHVLESSSPVKTCDLENKESVVEEDSNGFLMVSENDSTIDVLESSPQTRNFEGKESVVKGSNGACLMVSEDASTTHVLESSPSKKTHDLDAAHTDQDNMGLNLTVMDELCRGVSALLDVKVIGEIDSCLPPENQDVDVPLEAENSITEPLKNQVDPKMCDQEVDHDANMKAAFPISVTIASKESLNDLNPISSEDTKLETEKFSSNVVIDADDGIVAADTSRKLNFEVSKTGESFMWADTEISSDENAIQTQSRLSSDLYLADNISSQVVPSCLSPTRATVPDSGYLLNQIKVTPSRSSNKKKATTTPKMVIKVLDDNKENNNSGGMSLKNSFKPIMVVAEEKENKNNNEGEDGTQKIFKNMSLRQLKKMCKEIVNNTNNQNVIAKEQQKLENSRSALQTLSDNCLVGDAEN